MIPSTGMKLLRSSSKRPFRTCGPYCRAGIRSTGLIYSPATRRILITEKGGSMPEKEVVEQAKEDLKEGKSPSTAAGEFVHEEIEHVREGKHGARSPQQAIAIGLSKARRAGIPLPPPKAGKTSKSTRASAERDYRKGQSATKKKTSAKRSRATEDALKKEPRSTVSHKALSAHAKKAAKSR